MSTTRLKGELEIDHDRGVIYFHNEKGYTTLRICSLPTIPKPTRAKGVTYFDNGNLYQLDISHMHGANWSKE